MALRKSKKVVKQNKTKTAAAADNLGRNNWLGMFFMMLAVFLVGAGMVIGYFKFLDPDNKEAVAKEKAQDISLASMDLGDMVVNLAGDGGTRFLKTNITIEYDADKKVAELVQAKKPHIIEEIQFTLRKKTAGDIKPPETTEELKQELITAINQRLGVEEAVQKIIFTQFIVQ